MPEPVRLALTLVPLGVCLGMVGSMIGLGGGFFMVPFLLMVPVIPGQKFVPVTATAASLGTVFLSSASATVGNLRRGRVDLRTGAVLVAAALPGVWMGRETIGRLSSRAFSYAFGGLLLGVALYFFSVRLRPGHGLVKGRSREIVDREGRVYRYHVNAWVGAAVGLGVGVLSALFGVSGGLLVVPFLVVVFGMPTIVGTATAQFVSLFSAGAGLADALRRGQLTPAGAVVILWTGLGMVIGAQVGVAVAKRIRPRIVQVMLVMVLGTVATLMFLGS